MERLGRGVAAETAPGTQHGAEMRRGQVAGDPPEDELPSHAADGAQASEQPAAARALERANQAVEGGRAALAQHRHERRERIPVDGVEPPAAGGKREQEHVEVAHRPDRVPEPGELVARPPDGSGGEDGLEEAKSSAQASGRNAQLVHGLGLAGPDTGFLASEDLQLEPERARDRLPCRVVGRQLQDAEGGRPATPAAAAHRARLVPASAGGATASCPAPER